MLTIRACVINQDYLFEQNFGRSFEDAVHCSQEGAPGFIVKDDDDRCVWKGFAPFAILTPNQKYLAIFLENNVA